MKLYLGLGGNEPNRGGMLKKALNRLSRVGELRRVAPVFETPALLKADAPAEWNRPFLNTAAELETNQQISSVLREVKTIETELGRKAQDKWAPRPIDIDILLTDQGPIETRDLIVPHPEIQNRAFVLDPLSHLIGDTRLYDSGQTLLSMARTHRLHQPVLMKIINITPDSFSGDGILSSQSATDWSFDECQIVDVGAESTRPGATSLNADEEWSRLETVLPRLLEVAQSGIHLKISLDTRHPDNARRALDLGVSMINDVTGLSHPDMLKLASESKAEFVFMHSLSVPAEKSVVWPEGTDVVSALNEWLEQKLSVFDEWSIPRNRLIFDPGIGFGKTAVQSLQILQRIREIQHPDLRMLVGHSRKSFFNLMTRCSFRERDLETIGSSLALAQSGVDIIRVHSTHNVHRAMLAFQHLHNQYDAEL